MLSGIPEIYSDEFDFLLETLRANDVEYKVWALQGVALSSKPLSPTERGHVEGTCPRWSQKLPGTASLARLGDIIGIFTRLGYASIVGEQFVLSEKGRAFADYATSLGYLAYMLNDQVFLDDYVPFYQRNLKFKVAPEPK